jgi:hypothetical protein
MRFHARTWPIGCVIAVGLGTTVPSHWWANQSRAAIRGPLDLVEDTTTGQSQENAGTETDRVGNLADE